MMSNRVEWFKHVAYVIPSTRAAISRANNYYTYITDVMCDCETSMSDTIGKKKNNIMIKRGQIEFTANVHL